MEDAIFQQWDEFDDYNEDYNSLISKLNDENAFRSFGEGLLHFLQKKQPDLSIDSAIDFLETLCQENNVPVNDIACSNTLKKWFKGGPRPKKGDDSRKSMFALAFALKLNTEETAELFHKVYFDRAFDYRNEKEIIYYFCLHSNKAWQDACRLIEIADKTDSLSDDHTVFTSQIQQDIEMIKDESALLLYIAKHGHNRKKKNVSAQEVRKRLLSEANSLAKEESEQPEYTERFRGYNKESFNFTYEVITDMVVAGEKGTKTLFKNARLPKEIKSRFPEALTLSKKDPTYEELRKLTILLASYIFWFRMQQNGTPIDIDDYIEELNVFLDESGFSLVYYGNPYDWLFLYCTLSDRPLDTFRAILTEVLESEE